MGATPTKITKQWADTPFRLIETPRKRLGITDPKKASGAVNAASEMALVHNCIIRALNCIYLQAPNVKLEKDIADFVTFMPSWIKLIDEHHGNEETFFFPLLEEAIGTANYMEKNVEQHRSFTPGVKQFEEHVVALKVGKETYDSVKLRGIIDSFGSTLTEHLTEEIQSIEDLERFGDKIGWESINKRTSEHAVANADKEYGIPLFVTNMDLTFEDPVHSSVWPPFPWIAGLVFRWMYIPKHSGAWRFCSCDGYGMPRELEFVEG